MFTQIQSSINTHFSQSPFFVKAVWAQNLDEQTVTNLEYSAHLACSLVEKIPKLLKSDVHNICSVVKSIKPGESLYYKSIFFQCSDNNIQVFIDLSSQKGKGSSATVYKGRRILIERNDSCYLFVQTEKIVLSKLLAFKSIRANENKLLEAVSRIQAAEIFNDKPGIVPTFGWCLLSTGNDQNFEISLMHFMPKFEMDLFTYLNKNVPNKISKLSKLKVLKDTAKALRVMHAMGLVHHDVKPENILVNTHPGTNEIKEVALCDFGLMTSISRKDPRFLRFSGTLEYLPREFVIGMKQSEALRNKTIIHCTNQKLDFGSLGLVMALMDGRNEPGRVHLIEWGKLLKEYSKPKDKQVGTPSRKEGADQNKVSNEEENQRSDSDTDVHKDENPIQQIDSLFYRWFEESGAALPEVTSSYEGLINALMGPPLDRPLADAVLAKVEILEKELIQGPGQKE